MTDAHIPIRFLAWGDDTPEAVGFAEKRDGQWHETNWREYSNLIRSVGRALLGVGIESGDAIAIVGSNRPRWVIADVATMAVGAVSVGVYPSNSAAQLHRIVAHSRARLVFVDGSAQINKIVGDRLTGVEHIVLMESDDGCQLSDSRIVPWKQFLESAAAVKPEQFEQRLASLSDDAPAMFVYTSGTTAEPRAVVLTHRSLVACSVIGIQMIPHREQGMRSISYLPLAHIAERGLSVLGPALLGYAVHFVEFVERLPQDLIDVRPSFFLGVPRLYEKVKEKLGPRLDGAKGVGGWMIRWARRVASEYVSTVMKGEQPTKRLERRYNRARKYVLSRIHIALGWDRCTTFLTGAAPVALDVLEFFASVGILIQEVYGLSETGGPATFNREDAVRFGSVGRPFDGVDIRIAPDGEILVRGENLFAGYYRDSDATSEALRDGWLHTGDLGETDEAGFLFVTGRKKDIIVTAGGKNISPRPIERLIEEHEYVKRALLVGDRRKYVSALIVPDIEVVATRLGSFRLSPGDAVPEEVRSAIASHLDAVNSRLARPETIKTFALLPREIDAAHGELTPTQKVIRSAVLRNFNQLIESLYE